MSDGYLLSGSTVRAIAADHRRLEQLPFNSRLPGLLDSSPDQPEPPTTVQNMNAAAAPAFGLLAVTGSKVIGLETILTVDKPSSTSAISYVVNGPDPIQPNAYGPVQRGPIINVLFDTGSPALNDIWGAKAGQWTASKTSPGIIDVLGTATLFGTNTIVGRLRPIADIVATVVVSDNGGSGAGAPLYANSAGVFPGVYFSLDATALVSGGFPKHPNLTSNGGTLCWIFPIDAPAGLGTFTIPYVAIAMVVNDGFVGVKLSSPLTVSGDTRPVYAVSGANDRTFWAKATADSASKTVSAKLCDGTGGSLTSTVITVTPRIPTASNRFSLNVPSGEIFRVQLCPDSTGASFTPPAYGWVLADDGYLDEPAGTLKLWGYSSGAIPLGWAKANGVDNVAHGSGKNYINMVLRGDTAGGNTGGADSYTITGVNTGPPSSTISGSGSGTSYPSATHTHLIPDIVVPTLPAYMSVLVIERLSTPS